MIVAFPCCRRLFVIAGRGPAYSGPQRWDLYVGPLRQPRERRGIGRCVRCMCELCRVEEGLSRREQLGRELVNICQSYDQKIKCWIFRHCARGKDGWM